MRHWHIELSSGDYRRWCHRTAPWRRFRIATCQTASGTGTAIVIESWKTRTQVRSWNSSGVDASYRHGHLKVVFD